MHSVAKSESRGMVAVYVEYSRVFNIYLFIDVCGRLVETSPCSFMLFRLYTKMEVFKKNADAVLKDKWKKEVGLYV